MRCHVTGIGLWGPGLPGWPAAAEMLRGQAPWVHSDAARPVATEPSASSSGDLAGQITPSQLRSRHL